MTHPAPAWPPAPQAPEAPPAPLAPPPSPPPTLPAGFAMPADAASMLDVSVPLAPVQQHAAPHRQSGPAADSSPMPPAPALPMLPAPPAPAAAAADPAMPYPPAQALSTLEFQVPVQPDETPALIDGIAAARAEGVAEQREAATGEPAAAWSPSIALVAAMFALAWQLVSYYAGSVLPHRVAAGVTLDHYDTIVRGLPLVDGAAGGLVGTVLGFGTLVLLLLGVRRGVREPVLQGAVALLATIAAAGSVLLPTLAA